MPRYFVYLALLRIHCKDGQVIIQVTFFVLASQTPHVSLLIRCVASRMRESARSTDSIISSSASFCEVSSSPTAAAIIFKPPSLLCRASNSASLSTSCCFPCCSWTLAAGAPVPPSIPVLVLLGLGFWCRQAAVWAVEHVVCDDPENKEILMV